VRRCQKRSSKLAAQARGIFTQSCAPSVSRRTALLMNTSSSHTQVFHACAAPRGQAEARHVQIRAMTRGHNRTDPAAASSRNSARRLRNKVGLVNRTPQVASTSRISLPGCGRPSTHAQHEHSSLVGFQCFSVLRGSSLCYKRSHRRAAVLPFGRFPEISRGSASGSRFAWRVSRPYGRYPLARSLGSTISFRTPLPAARQRCARARGLETSWFPALQPLATPV